MSIDNSYENMLRYILNNGVDKEDRTGTGTRSVFGYQLRYDLSNGQIPLITTKKIHLKSIIVELLWFLRGETNTRYLKAHDVTIWDEWADENGNLGPVYGAQWRNFHGYHDQIKALLKDLKENPDSRRHLVTAWDPTVLSLQALPPCHVMFQCYVANGKLSLQVYQRSADSFLGVPFNIASYAILTRILARSVGLAPGELIWTGGDVHIYKNHMAQVNQQLGREVYEFPVLFINQRVDTNLEHYDWTDFEVINYKHHPAIKAEVAV